MSLHITHITHLVSDTSYNMSYVTTTSRQHWGKTWALDALVFSEVSKDLDWS